MDTQEQEKQNTKAANQGNSRFWESFPKPTGWSARWDKLELDREAQLKDQAAEIEAHEDEE